MDYKKIIEFHLINTVNAMDLIQNLNHEDLPTLSKLSNMIRSTFIGKDYDAERLSVFLDKTTEHLDTLVDLFGSEDMPIGMHDDPVKSAESMQSHIQNLFLSITIGDLLPVMYESINAASELLIRQQQEIDLAEAIEHVKADKDNPDIHIAFGNLVSDILVDAQEGIFSDMDVDVFRVQLGVDDDGFLKIINDEDFVDAPDEITEKYRKLIEYVNSNLADPNNTLSIDDLLMNFEGLLNSGEI